MGKATKGVRFGAGSEEGPRAGLWRLWTSPNSDVYLAVRTLAQVVKVSLHASGRWRVAFTDDEMASVVGGVSTGEDRAFQKWQRPPPAQHGFTMALQIAAPKPDIITPPVEDQVEVTWVPCPDNSELIFMVAFGGTVDEQASGTTLIYSEQLGNGEVVSLVWRTRPLTDRRRHTLVEHRRAAVAQAESHGAKVDCADPRTRLVTFGEENGVCVLQDLAAAALATEAQRETSS